VLTLPNALIQYKISFISEKRYMIFVFGQNGFALELVDQLKQ